ncbi:hypothetical protein BCT47_02445 [Vibrio splendidus]|jgi:hypothetical protein|uniref:Uncharacterized protein n=3 Tax=Vibrio TaxID=662 RepID=A0AB35N4V1_VIBSP|nr:MULTISPECIES: hypothetical protein [Vibrio]MDH5933619.1 hypothetical protein [Vibrio splendidus]MDP2503921.1 hypothetical protein [Vibrio splendidus]MDP2592356.1 hypothetical protein [Vibrio splendidus]OEF65360.1 hypothetical protein A152_05910 [Vibrio tasmaniensis 1F-187]OEF81643.1 hypothetical protein A162_13410 [Vibrio tasmaniensis 1F-155]
MKPFSKKVKTHRLNTLIDKVQGTGTYRVEVGHIDDQEVIHLLLHRTEKQMLVDLLKVRKCLAARLLVYVSSNSDPDMSVVMKAVEGGCWMNA